MMLEHILYKHFGYTTFRKGQKEIIEDLLGSKDVIALLPTGAGKSLCYQVPAYVLDGCVVVVSPLLSLMEDQVNQLRLFGEKRAIAFNSFRTFAEKSVAIGQLHSYKFIFLSPEMLQYDPFFQALTKQCISLFVVDEAHCISQWGHEFRPDYLKLNYYRQQLRPQATLALTATASSHVVKDIQLHLGLDYANLHIHSLDRPNIAYVVEKVENVDIKLEKLLTYVKQLQGPGIVYCGSRKWTVRLTEYLQQHGVGRVAYYHGGMPQEDRMLIQQQFINGQLDVIACTSAFGMGINKKDVRYVIHFQFSANIESYVQEIGRAGRDGKDSIAILLYTALDEELPKLILEEELPSCETVQVICQLLASYKESITITRDNENAIIQQLGIPEVHWRYLRYHFEQNGVIEQQQIQVAKLTQEIVNRLCRHIIMRLDEKQRKLQEMQKWIYTSQCRREALLEVFEQHIEEKRENCCDYCGVDVQRYDKDESICIIDEEKDWEGELNRLLRL